MIQHLTSISTRINKLQQRYFPVVNLAAAVPVAFPTVSGGSFQVLVVLERHLCLWNMMKCLTEPL